MTSPVPAICQGRQNSAYEYVSTHACTHTYNTHTHTNYKGIN